MLRQRSAASPAATTEIKTALAKAKTEFSEDLDQKLNALERRSVQQRWLAMIVFGITILVAAVIVHVTIKRSITGPVLRVIQGVQEAADGAAEASNQMSESGGVVARDAQEQAACIRRNVGVSGPDVGHYQGERHAGGRSGLA